MPGVCVCVPGVSVLSLVQVLLCARGVWLCAKGGVWLCDGLCARGRVQLCARGMSGYVHARGGWHCARGEVWLVLCGGGSGCVPGGVCKKQRVVDGSFSPHQGKCP